MVVSTMAVTSQHKITSSGAALRKASRPVPDKGPRIDSIFSRRPTADGRRPDGTAGSRWSANSGAMRRVILFAALFGLLCVASHVAASDVEYDEDEFELPVATPEV